ncbi:T9SS type B sorting domain-containing protein [Kaistella sp.]|uniref:T9SS type B sorting domain-containing protein n=1 Tax=Kaistella sp. TaxID=2782235 RepID=UPI002F9561F2
MKKLLLLLFAFISIATTAQLDREHWFAPMVDRAVNGSNYQTIYMSTNETTAFKVDVYNNNTIIGSVTISKNNPGKFNVNRSYIITTSQSDLFRSVAKGIYLKGNKPFFASLRFSIFNHAEILTSKGTAGIGTEFRAVMAVARKTVNNGNSNFMASVMATEDNTNVTVAGFKPGTVFSATPPSIVGNSFTFTLNKGQSYIIDGISYEYQNKDSFIGSKITSDKPVTITNGNFNGQYVATSANSTDILMDQGVPVDKLGQEFVLMKGNGDINSGMEKAIIVATEDNTEIYLNNSTTPIAVINAGQYYETQNTAYILQAFNHYNMRINTSKNVYVYQLLAGDGGSSMIATGGFNYIPPLSCYLPKKIDEIGLIDENYFQSNSNPGGILNIPTKLNIITERGATVDVKRNGTSMVLSALNGPFNVVGNANWVTYSIPGVYGNIAVFSSKAVTAGISAGNDAVGYGGYFAGFSFIPAITKTEGDCLPGVKLEVTEGFDSYEWVIKNPDGTYSPAPGTNNTFTYIPPQAGIYAVKVKQGSCAEIQTQDFKFYNCTTFTNYDYNSCGTETIIPKFALSSQAVNPSTVQIVTPPTKGTVIAADGKVSYTANPGVSGTDTFKFSFCGIGPIPDCETVQITIKMIEKYDKVLEECSTTGIATYNLTLAPVSPDTDITKTYFTSQNGAENDIAADMITNFTAYTSANTSVYVRIKNSIGCVAVAKIDLRAKLAPEVKENLYTKLHCDEDVDGKIDGIYKVDLTTVTPTVLVQASNFVVKYYDTLPKATAGLNNNITGIFSFTGNTSVWIRVDAPNGCPPVIKEIQLKIGTKFTVATPQSKIVCDTNLDNTENISLNDYLSLFTGDTAATVKFFSTLANAQNNTPAIAANQTITGDKTFYYRFSRTGFCDEIGVLHILFKKATPSTTLPANVTVCQGGTTTLDVGTGYTGILWSTGANTQTITAGAGTYTVDFTNTDGCTYRQTVTVIDSPKPQWNMTAYNAVNCDDNFDGIINVRFSNITPLIVQNAALFTVEYSLFSDFRALLPNNWTYSADTPVFVRAYSTVCPAEVKQIDFKIGNALPLISITQTVTVCDNDANGTENINLATYRNLFTTDAAATVRYFATLANAQANTPTISAAQALTGNKTFYYRFKKTGFCDVIGTLNIVLKTGTPSTTLPATVNVCQGSTTTLNVGTGYTTILWSTGADTPTVNVGAGTYWVDLTNASGCVYRQTVTVANSPKPRWNIAAYNAVNCDDNFDGIINVKFSTITPLIVQNSALFTVEYSIFSDFRTILPNDWTYTADATVFVRAYSTVCPAEVKQIDFKIGNSLPLLHASAAVKVCDDDSDAVKSVNLANYIQQFITDTGVTATYYQALTDAQNKTNPISNQVSVNGNGTYYLRFHKNNFCDVIGQLTVNVQIPKKSPELADKQICPGTTTVLDAGQGFDAYLWSTGATTSSANVPVGNYWVDLTHNGCTYRQTVSVTAVSLPEITSVQIQGSTVTVTATGGNPPYQYAIDGGTYQSSNIFTNVRGGDHIISVISADNCSPVTATINVIELYNAITPNGDGINDVLNYSALLQKEEPFLQIFDRYGKLVFTGDQNNRFTWDGRIVGKGVGTGTFWYVMRWKEPGFTAVTEYSGWVLVKNRE